MICFPWLVFKESCPGESAFSSLEGLEVLEGMKWRVCWLSESKGVTQPVMQGSAYPSFTRITLHFLCFEIDIKTTAVKKGNEYVINGGKMWTTSGCQADWMCLLANTSEGPPHRNKSLICLPMNLHGNNKELFFLLIQFCWCFSVCMIQEGKVFKIKDYTHKCSSELNVSLAYRVDSEMCCTNFHEKKSRGKKQMRRKLNISDLTIARLFNFLLLKFNFE